MGLMAMTNLCARAQGTDRAFVRHDDGGGGMDGVVYNYFSAEIYTSASTNPFCVGIQGARKDDKEM